MLIRILTLTLWLLLIGCSGKQGAQMQSTQGRDTQQMQQQAFDPMLVRMWQIIKVDDHKIQDDDYEISITKDGRLIAYFGCNHFMGHLAMATHGQFKLASGLASTRMFCQHTNEAQFMKALQSVVAYEVITSKSPFERLILRDITGKVRLEGQFRIF